jgi:hypothetical protein
MLIRFLIILLLAVGLTPQANASGHPKPIATLPFDMVGTYIVLKVRINGNSPLNLVLDSGIGSTIITEMTSEDSITLTHTRKTTMKGLGAGEGLEAWISDSNQIQIGKIHLKDQTVMILVEDIFNLSRHTGSKINGILGAEFFEKNVVRVDYTKRKIILYDPSDFVVPKGFMPIPITLDKHKMFMELPIQEVMGRIRTVRMLIDTGAELAAWFRSYGKNAVPVPARKIKGYIGRGLNGDIEGALGRIPKIWIGDFPLQEPVVSFPDSASVMEALINIQRDGTIGSQILSRFDLIFDQNSLRLYVRPNWNYKKRFMYNMAGIEVVQHKEGIQLPEVLNVWKQSPGEEAGVKAGDYIMEINGINGFKITINEIKSIFETRINATINLILLREGKTIFVHIPLKNNL